MHSGTCLFRSSHPRLHLRLRKRAFKYQARRYHICKQQNKQSYKLKAVFRYVRCGRKQLLPSIEGKRASYATDPYHTIPDSTHQLTFSPYERGRKKEKNYLIISPPSFSIPSNPSRISLPPSTPLHPSTPLLVSLQTS